MIMISFAGGRQPLSQHQPHLALGEVSFDEGQFGKGRLALSYVLKNRTERLAKQVGSSLVGGMLFELFYRHMLVPSIDQNSP